MTRTLALVSSLLFACGVENVPNPVGGGDGGGTTSSAGGGTATAGGAGGGDAGGAAGGTTNGTGGGTTGTGGGAATPCMLMANTSPTTSVVNGCALLNRDVSGCRAAREAAGFTGYWLEYSCRVTLSFANDPGSNAPAIKVHTDGQPDYRSNFFFTTDACWENYTTQMPNPNHIVAKNMDVYIPVTPGGTGIAMPLGVTGVALNGVSLFNNMARPGDDIFAEIASFDRCQAHPTGGNTYHYHVEPPAISQDDAKFIGVFRDGYALYGRRDADGSTPTNLDASGGHVGTTPHSTTPVFHYHVHEQTQVVTNGPPKTGFFLSTGQYHAAPGMTCTGCM